jgi:hypothetical protein
MHKIRAALAPMNNLDYSIKRLPSFYNNKALEPETLQMQFVGIGHCIKLH